MLRWMFLTLDPANPGIVQTLIQTLAKTLLETGKRLVVKGQPRVHRCKPDRVVRKLIGQSQSKSVKADKAGQSVMGGRKGNSWE